MSFLRAACLMLSASALLGACASPPVSYYTLLGPRTGEGGAGRPAAEAGAAVAAVQVMPVSIPAEIDTPQIVVRTGQGEVLPLNGDRWAGPLADQLRTALADALAARLDVPVVETAMPAGQQGAWRVQVEVRRFESDPGAAAIMDAVWRVYPQEQARGGAEPLCRARYSTEVAGDIPALVRGHQRNLDRLADDIAGALQSGARPGRCPA